MERILHVINIQTSAKYAIECHVETIFQMISMLHEHDESICEDGIGMVVARANIHRLTHHLHWYFCATKATATVTCCTFYNIFYLCSAECHDFHRIDFLLYLFESSIRIGWNKVLFFPFHTICNLFAMRSQFEWWWLIWLFFFQKWIQVHIHISLTIIMFIEKHIITKTKSNKQMIRR